MRTYKAAKAYAESQRKNPTQNWYNLCQKFSRNCVGADVFGGTAYSAWLSIPSEHRHSSSPPPPGSLAYYVSPSLTGAGHVVFVVEDGKVYSNDLKRRGMIDLCHYMDPVNKWGMKYLGWIDWTPSGAINLKPDKPKEEPDPNPIDNLIYEDGMFVFKTHRNKAKDGDGVGDGAHYIVTGNSMIQVAGGYDVSSNVEIIASASEDTDNAMYAAFKGRRFLLNGSVK